MRRLKRAILRHQAERKGVKPSAYVNNMWRRIQAKRYGEKLAKRFLARGTKPKRKWRNAA